MVLNQDFLWFIYVLQAYLNVTLGWEKLILTYLNSFLTCDSENWILHIVLCQIYVDTIFCLFCSWTHFVGTSWCGYRLRALQARPFDWPFKVTKSEVQNSISREEKKKHHPKGKWMMICFIAQLISIWKRLISIDWACDEWNSFSRGVWNLNSLSKVVEARYWCLGRGVQFIESVLSMPWQFCTHY